MKLQGKVAVVTGAASGIGRAIAILFAQEGAHVVASDINLEGVKETIGIIEKNGGHAIAIKSNVASEEDVQVMIDTAVKTFGTVDILINNAGIMDNMEPVGDLTDAQWDRVMAVNTTSVMRTTRKVIPLFLDKGAGVIVNIASIGGLFGKVAGCAYTASKHAVIGITKSTGWMYAQKGIRCNAIAPGAVATNIASTMTNVNPFGGQRAGSTVQLNPRFGKPEEIAGAALFLASDDSSFVNGTVITVDGGWMA
ncbi:MAG: SDR family oxidoreductase [Candidatus Izemoplasmatales bacterium]|nr:SDR family oxidoreductase [Candidatus Izemoplasmatales bacterium]MDD3865670.1 SDR family oxidoreductase [Candidatus Izemoplasmatales bacterium]